MSKAKKYRAKLEKVLKNFTNRFDVAEIRGSDVASFIVAEKGNRAVEIYQSKDAVIVEFWEKEEHQTEKEVNSYETATELTLDWIGSYL